MKDNSLPVQKTTQGIGRNSVQATRAIQGIEALDFAELKAKLMIPEPEGYGWSKEQTDGAEIWYKRFLMLRVLYPKHKNSPSVPVDKFWHAHILDTRRYAEDCQTIFGHFVHHFPYFGLRGDREELRAAFQETNMLYRQEFGTDANTALLGAGHVADCSDPCSTDDGSDDSSDD